MRTLTSLLGNSQRLDGGAMLGNAPRAQKWAPADELMSRTASPRLSRTVGRERQTPEALAQKDDQYICRGDSRRV